MVALIPSSRFRMGYALSAIACAAALAAAPAAAADSLTVDEALERVRAANPILASRSLEIQARQARAADAAAGPNPQLEVEAENFAGSGAYAGADALETTMRASQAIELGGKRPARKRAAESEKALAEWDFGSERARIEAEVRIAFAEVLGAQELLRILQAGLEVNRQILATARLRHQAGKAPATEEMKARMAASLAHIELDRAGQEWAAAKIRLASFWSAEPPAFAGVRGDLAAIAPLPPLDSLLPLLAGHPDLARWKAEEAQRRAVLDAARAEGVPDVSVGGGVRRIQVGSSGEVALVAGVSMPIPLFNRNRGAVREAEKRLAKADPERRAAEAGLTARLRALHQHLVAQAEEISHLEDELIPDSERTLAASHEAYRMGKLGFLEVLDSRRTRDEIGTRYIAALTEYQKEWSELQSLTSFGARPNP